MGYADVPTWVATYDRRDVTVCSPAKVLLGKISPLGKLPVTIPGACSFGAGLTW